jgi:8-oxo-dGTP pyrophosphatase MutT (NUDIX family)
MADYIQEIRALVGNKRILLNGACALVFDAQDRLLLQRRQGSGDWGLPSGFMEVGEKVEDTVRREVWEETGITLGRLELFGVYSGRERFVDLPNGHEIALVRFVFTCREFTGVAVAAQAEETLDVGWFPLDALPENRYAPQRQVFADLLSGKPTPILD